MTDLIHSPIYSFTQRILTNQGHVSVPGRRPGTWGGGEGQIDGHLLSWLSLA